MSDQKKINTITDLREDLFKQYDEINSGESYKRSKVKDSVSNANSIIRTYTTQIIGLKESGRGDEIANIPGLLDGIEKKD